MMARQPPQKKAVEPEKEKNEDESERDQQRKDQPKKKEKKPEQKKGPPEGYLLKLLDTLPQELQGRGRQLVWTFVEFMCHSNAPLADLLRSHAHVTVDNFESYVRAVWREDIELDPEDIPDEERQPSQETNKVSTLEEEEEEEEEGNKEGESRETFFTPGAGTCLQPNVIVDPQVDFGPGDEIRGTSLGRLDNDDNSMIMVEISTRPRTTSAQNRILPIVGDNDVPGPSSGLPPMGYKPTATIDDEELVDDDNAVLAPSRPVAQNDETSADDSNDFDPPPIEESSDDDDDSNDSSLDRFPSPPRKVARKESPSSSKKVVDVDSVFTPTISPSSSSHRSSHSSNTSSSSSSSSASEPSTPSAVLVLSRTTAKDEEWKIAKPRFPGKKVKPPSGVGNEEANRRQNLYKKATESTQSWPNPVRVSRRSIKKGKKGGNGPLTSRPPGSSDAAPPPAANRLPSPVAVNRRTIKKTKNSKEPLRHTGAPEPGGRFPSPVAVSKRTLKKKKLQGLSRQTGACDTLPDADDNRFPSPVPVKKRTVSKKKAKGEASRSAPLKKAPFPKDPRIGTTRPGRKNNKVTEQYLRNPSTVVTARRPPKVFKPKNQVKQRGTIARRLTNHALVRPFRCEICDQMFTRDDNRQRHVREKHPTTQQIFVCNEKGCHAQFRLERNRLEHFQSAHNPDPIKYYCEVCRKMYYSRQARDYHQRTCNGRETGSSSDSE